MKSILFFCLTLISAGSALPLELGSPFSENMVLQRQSEIPVWGWGKPASEVRVTIADKKAAATVAEDGSWKLKLDAIPAGGPYQFQVTSDSETITCKNVLVGDVWICSGQSNMQMPYAKMAGSKQILANRKGRPIRCMEVKRTVSLAPSQRCQGQWSSRPVPSAVALAFSYHLQKDLDIPVGIILTCWGSSWLEGWMPKDMTEELPHFDQMMRDFEKNDRQKVESLIKKAESGKRAGKGQKWSRENEIYLRTRPNIVYNAMLHPLAPYAVRGIVWYQGESNARSIEDMMQYRQSLQKWCQRMRALWQHDDLHLLVVMLPKFKVVRNGKSIKDPTAHSWAWIRESQMKILDLPHTSIVNTIDLGNPNNIHPPDKAPIGQRLALLAQRDALGKTLLAQGPKMKSVTIHSDEIVIAYENAEGLATTDGEAVRGFWVAGKSRQWKAATGQIKGETVVLSCGDTTPEVVRYAFCAVPNVNLINAAKLPALPFRTDTDKP
ncbi:MAG: sialate O-acetylesterase [Planctomycetota bacterium]